MALLNINSQGLLTGKTQTRGTRSLLGNLDRKVRSFFRAVDKAKWSGKYFPGDLVYAREPGTGKPKLIHHCVNIRDIAVCGVFDYLEKCDIMGSGYVDIGGMRAFLFARDENEYDHDPNIFLTVCVLYNDRVEYCQYFVNMLCEIMRVNHYNGKLPLAVNDYDFHAVRGRHPFELKQNDSVMYLSVPQKYYSGIYDMNYRVPGEKDTIIVPLEPLDSPKINRAVRDENKSLLDGAETKPWYDNALRTNSLFTSNRYARNLR